MLSSTSDEVFGDEGEISIPKLLSRIEKFSPELSCPINSDFKKEIDILPHQYELFPNDERDPDVTQLEIDISSASISNSQLSKKRQLIVMTDNIDIESMHSNSLNCPFYEEN